MAGAVAGDCVRWYYYCTSNTTSLPNTWYHDSYISKWRKTIRIKWSSLEKEMDSREAWRHGEGGIKYGLKSSWQRLRWFQKNFIDS